MDVGRGGSPKAQDAAGGRLAPLDHVRELYKGVVDLLPPGRDLTRKLDLIKAVRSPGGSGARHLSPSPSSNAIHLAFTSAPNSSGANAGGSSPLASLEAIGDVDRLLKAASRHQQQQQLGRGAGVGGRGGSPSPLTDNWGSLVVGDSAEATNKALADAEHAFVMESRRYNELKRGNELKDRKAAELRAELEGLERENRTLTAIEQHTHLSSLNATLVFGPATATGSAPGSSLSAPASGDNPWDSDEERQLAAELEDGRRQQRTKRLLGKGREQHAGAASSGDLETSISRQDGSSAVSPGGKDKGLASKPRSAHHYLLSGFSGALGASISNKTSLLEDRAETLQRAAQEQNRLMMEAVAAQTPALRVAGTAGLGASASMPALSRRPSDAALPPLMEEGAPTALSSVASASELVPRSGSKRDHAPGAAHSKAEVVVSFSEAAQVVRIKELQQMIALTKRSIERKAFQARQYERMVQRLKSNAATFDRHLKFLDGALRAATKETNEVHTYLKMLEASRDGALAALHGLQRSILGEEALRRKDLEQKRSELQRAKQIEALRQQRVHARKQLEAELNGDLSLQQEAELLESLGVLQVKLQQLQAERREREGRAMALQDAFLAIKASTGINDLLLMARRFDKGQEISRALEQEKVEAQQRLAAAKRDMERAREDFEAMTTTAMAVAPPPVEPSPLAIFLVSPIAVHQTSPLGRFEGQSHEAAEEEVHLNLPASLISPEGSLKASTIGASNSASLAASAPSAASSFFFTSPALKRQPSLKAITARKNELQGTGGTPSTALVPNPSSAAWHEQIGALQTLVNEEKVVYRSRHAEMERLESLLLDAKHGAISLNRLLTRALAPIAGNSTSFLPPSPSAAASRRRAGPANADSRQILTDPTTGSIVLDARGQGREVTHDLASARYMLANALSTLRTRALGIIRDSCEANAASAEREAREQQDKAQAVQEKVEEARAREAAIAAENSLTLVKPPSPSKALSGSAAGSSSSTAFLTALDDDIGAAPVAPVSVVALPSAPTSPSFSNAGRRFGLGALSEPQAKLVQDARHKAKEARSRAAFLSHGALIVAGMLEAGDEHRRGQSTAEAASGPSALLHLFADLMASGREELLREQLQQSRRAEPSAALAASSSSSSSADDEQGIARAAVAAALLAVTEREQARHGHPSEEERNAAGPGSDVAEGGSDGDGDPLHYLGRLRGLSRSTIEALATMQTSMFTPALSRPSSDASSAADEERSDRREGEEPRPRAAGESSAPQPGQQAEKVAGAASPKSKRRRVSAAFEPYAVIAPSSPSMYSAASGFTAGGGSDGASAAGRDLAAMTSSILAASSPAAAAATLQTVATRVGKGPIMVGAQLLSGQASVSANASTVSAPMPPAPTSGLTQEQVAIARAAQAAAARLMVREGSGSRQGGGGGSTGGYGGGTLTLASLAVGDHLVDRAALKSRATTTAADLKAAMEKAAAAAALAQGKAASSSKKDASDTEPGPGEETSESTVRGGGAKAGNRRAKAGTRK